MKTVLKLLGVLFASISLLGAQERVLPQQGVLASPNGRYAFGQINDSYRHAFMLDTQTGRLWRAVYSNEDSVVTLVPVEFKHQDGSKSLFPEDVRPMAPRPDKPLHQAPHPDQPNNHSAPNPHSP